MKKNITISVLLSSILLVLSGCGGTNQTVTSDIKQETNKPAVNSSPVATFKKFSINRNITFNGQLTAKDADLDVVEYKLTSQCKHGTVTVDENGCFTYTPDAGYKGSDSFSYKVKDELSSCPNQIVEIDVVQESTVIPTAPTNLKLEALSTCKVHISWDDNSDNETGFEIYKDGKLVSVVGKNTTTTDICKNMSPATTYKIEVKAKNIAGSSQAVSGLVTTKDITTPPDAPTNLTIPAIDKTTARLIWKDNSWNESSFEIYVNGVLNKTVSPNCHCAIVKGLEAGKEYTFLVVAKNKIGTSSSNSVKATTESEPVIPVDQAPTITINGTDETLVVADSYIDDGATANDAEDGSLEVVVSSDVNTSKAGNYTVTYTATDSTGQSASQTRNVKVIPASLLHTKATIPYDSNLELGNEEGILYYVDPRPEENGFNRALRIDYLNMTFTELAVAGINPHSIDRAGDSDKFYIRTQNSKSFDVISFTDGSVKTVDMGEHKPRAIGATNLKHHLQLISVKNRQVIDVIDTTTDTIIASLGNEADSYPIGTGHSLWFDEDHFGLIDRKNNQIIVYRVVHNGGVFNFIETDRVTTKTSIHALERVAHPITREDLVTFYANGEGDIAKGGTNTAYIAEYKFNPSAGKLLKTKSVNLAQSTAVVQGRPPITHHSAATPDGKFYYAPVFDGHVYIIDRATMNVVKVLDAALGAAHIEFSTSQNLALVTNHWSNELTIIDLATQSVKKRLILSETQHFDEIVPHLLQPHFSYLSKDGKYFYTFATQDGTFLEINLETFTIERKLVTGGSPEQAHS